MLVRDGRQIHAYRQWVVEKSLMRRVEVDGAPWVQAVENHLPDFFASVLHLHSRRAVQSKLALKDGRGEGQNGGMGTE